KRMEARISGGKPNSIMNATISRYHAMIGMRLKVMPGARTFSTDTMISIAAEIADISTNVMPSSQTSELMPGEYGFELSGVYMNQPLSGATPVRSAITRIAPPKT